MRLFLHHIISRKPRIRYRWFFTQSYILMRLKTPSRFWKKILVFNFFKEIHKKECFSKWHIRICDNVVRNFGQLPWIIFGNVMSEKTLFLTFWPILVKIHCLWLQIGVSGNSEPFSANPMMFYVYVFFLCFFPWEKKFVEKFWPLLWSKYWPVLDKKSNCL